MRLGRSAVVPQRQAGAAILTAMLTVVLVATLAATALWQQWRGIEIEAAHRTRVQSAWVGESEVRNITALWSRPVCPPFWQPTEVMRWLPTLRKRRFCQAASSTCNRGSM